MTITIDQIRALLGGDTTLTDDEINVVIDLESNAYAAAAVCATMLAAKYADKIDLKVGPIEVKESAKYDHWKTMALNFKQRASSAGSVVGIELMGTTVDEMENPDTDLVQPNFEMDIMDNEVDNG